MVSIQLVDELIRAKWLTPVVTHTGAPKHKIVRTRGTHPDWAHAETVVQEGPDLIQSLAKSKHYLIIVITPAWPGG